MQVVLDNAAASRLTRVQAPWLVGHYDWKGTKAVRKAVVWLSLKLGKPILKLTDEDYFENGMAELITLEGSSYEINVAIFKQLQNCITGKVQIHT